MRLILYIFLFQLILLKAEAQDPTSRCANFCVANLKSKINNYITDELTYYKPGTIASTCIPPNNVNCFTANVPYFDVHYLENYCDRDKLTDKYDCCDPNECTLKIHVYYPNPTINDYASCPLPAVILFHGGAYNECGDYNDGGIVNISQDLASRGFVVFNVNYRLGVITDTKRNVNEELGEENKNNAFVTAQQIMAIYRAVQDARGAIRSIIKMNSDGTFNPNGTTHPYKINTNQIFVGGVSAGSLIAMAACLFGDNVSSYLKFDQVCPGVQAAFSTPAPNLGTLDPPIYYASKAEVVNFHTNVIGILNCWGSLFVPTDQLTTPYDFYKGQGFTIPPIISFCGRYDPVFWYKHQGVYFSPSNATTPHFNTETRCVPQGSYTVPFDNITTPMASEYSLGSSDIYQMLTTPGGSNIPQAAELYIDCQMHHGLDVCAGCPYTSDFGVVSNIDEIHTYDYISARAGTFFQTIMGGASALANINESKFVECENDRVKCSGNSTIICNPDLVCPPDANPPQ